MIDASANSGFIKNAELKKEIAKLATTIELRIEQNIILKFQAFDWNNFGGKSCWRFSLLTNV